MAKVATTNGAVRGSNIWQRLHGVMAEIGAVEKKGKADKSVGGYPFQKIDDVEDAMRKALVTHGVFAYICKFDNRKIEKTGGQSRGGNPEWYAEVDVTVRCVNIDKPDETVELPGWGQGFDYSDKCTAKAVAYALKMAYLSAFHLRGQPDNESDDKEGRGRRGANGGKQKDNPVLAQILAKVAKTDDGAGLFAYATSLRAETDDPSTRRLNWTEYGIVREAIFDRLSRLGWTVERNEDGGVTKVLDDKGNDPTQPEPKKEKTDETSSTREGDSSGGDAG